MAGGRRRISPARFRSDPRSSSRAARAGFTDTFSSPITGPPTSRALPTSTPCSIAWSRSYGSCGGAKGINRVLRLPGFLHRKNPAAPFMVRIVKASGARYTREQIMKAFPPVDRIVAARRRARTAAPGRRAIEICIRRRRRDPAGPGPARRLRSGWRAQSTSELGGLRRRRSRRARSARARSRPRRLDRDRDTDRPSAGGG